MGKGEKKIQASRHLCCSRLKKVGTAKKDRGKEK